MADTMTLNPQAAAGIEETAARAMDRVRDEMAATKKDSVRAVGEVLTAMLQASPQTWAAALLTEGRTLEFAYKALETYARDHRAGATCVYVGPTTAARVLAEYYGAGPFEPQEAGAAMAGAAADAARELDAEARAMDEPPKPARMAAKAERQAPKTAQPARDEFDLDALLGGL